MSAHAPMTPVKSRIGQTLHDYLNDYKPEVPKLADSVTRSPNTRNHESYRFDDIPAKVPVWQGFTYKAMRRRYRKVLDRVVVAESAATSPQKGCVEKEFTSELSVQVFAARTVSLQVNRAFTALAPLPVSGRPSPEMVDRLGESISHADRVGLHLASNQIRVAGELKPSWKWLSLWQTAVDGTTDNTEFRQVLSQVHHYMNVHGTRYGYILTDQEFVAIRRRGKKFGDIMISKPVPWEGNGRGEMSLALAIWFLHKLAAEDKEWHAPSFPRSDEWEPEGMPLPSAKWPEKVVAKKATALAEGDGGGGKMPALRKSKRLAERGSA